VFFLQSSTSISEIPPINNFEIYFEVISKRKKKKERKERRKKRRRKKKKKKKKKGEKKKENKLPIHEDQIIESYFLE